MAPSMTRWIAPGTTAPSRAMRWRFFAPTATRARSVTPSPSVSVEPTEPAPSAASPDARYRHGSSRSRAFAQARRHHADGALIDLGPVPLLEDGIVLRARFPALPGLPAVPFQEVGGRGQHVRHAALEVATTIAVEVDGVPVVAGR